MNMLRKILLSSIAFSGFAATNAADWIIHSPFAGAEQMAETKNRVYFTSAGSLFAYDKVADETLVLNQLNDLNDVDVTGIYVPFNGNRAVVAYSNGNMDLLTDNGKVYNLPDIKDSRVNSKTINHIAFSDDGMQMLVATSFGIVRYNLEKMEVIDSGIFNKDITYTGYIGGRPAVFTENTLYLLDSDGSIRSLSTWKELGRLPHVTFMTSIGGELFATMNTEGYRLVKFLYPGDGNASFYTTLTDNYANQLGIGNPTEPLLLRTDYAIRSFTLDGSQIGTYPITNDIAGKPFTATDGVGNMWFGFENGISNADISSNPIYVANPIDPGTQSVKNVQHLAFGPSGNLYMGNRGNSQIYNVTTTGHTGYQAVMTPDGQFRNTTPKGLSLPWYGENNPNGYLFDAMFITEDASDPTSYYSGNLFHGIFKLSAIDGSELIHYDEDNTNIALDNGFRILDAKFDTRGFLWVLREKIETGPCVHILTPDGIAKGDAVSAADWAVLNDSEGFKSGRDGQFAISSGGRYIYVMGEKTLMVIDTKETASLSDDEAYQITNFRMSDGSGYISFDRLCRIMEDPADGSLWVGTTDGVFYMPKPWDVGSGIVDIVKPKVPRNDGTGLADYLLSSIKVFGLACDGAGHKWFTTDDSGVYMTNSKGTEILANYTASNSPLPSNRVFAVACNPDGDGRVYFGTEEGLMEYRSGYTAGAHDFNSVKIYPNPVKPDFRGQVTIEGLVDGSTVKIVSASGSLVAQITSEGGSAHWSPSSANGKRLPAGVYHVLASSNTASGKPVGKIMIIR